MSNEYMFRLHVEGARQAARVAGGQAQGEGGDGLLLMVIVL